MNLRLASTMCCVAVAQVRGLVGDRISLTVGTASAIAVSFILGLVIMWKLAFVVISVQPLIILSFYFKKVLLTQFAMETVRAQQGAAQVASEAIAQHRTVTAFSSQDKVRLSICPIQTSFASQSRKFNHELNHPL